MKKMTLLCSALLCMLSLAGCSAAMFASIDEAFACSDPLSLDCSIARQKANEARAAQQRYEEELENRETCYTYEEDGELVEDCWYNYHEPQKPAIDVY